MSSVRQSQSIAVSLVERWRAGAGAMEEEPASDEPRLHGRHILLDGYNLELPEGTGVKTYGVGLARTLAGLGARVSVLRSCRWSKYPVVQEALLHSRDPRCSPFDLLYSGVRALAGLSPPAREVVPSDTVVKRGHDHALAGLARTVYVSPHCFRLANTLFRLAGKALKLRMPAPVDVWHATYPLPITIQRARKITTIHDLIPLRLPWTTWDDKPFFDRVVREALATSDLIVTDSESAREDILTLYRVNPQRVRVVYPAVPPRQADLPHELLRRVLALYGLAEEGYFLFVGAVAPRKNLSRLCQALQLLRPRLPLVAAGPQDKYSDEELRHARPLLERKQLILLDHVPAAHLPALYAGALFLVFPSLYEGFGLPAVEAMAHGCPVLAANTSSLPEVCGEAALYLDPYNVDDMAEKIAVMLEDEKLRRDLRKKGDQRLLRFSANHHRHQLAEAYAAVL
jgi:glycosyltransferase involved in cell wall biosynthesis